MNSMFSSYSETQTAERGDLEPQKKGDLGRSGAAEERSGAAEEGRSGAIWSRQNFNIHHCLNEFNVQFVFRNSNGGEGRSGAAEEGRPGAILSKVFTLCTSNFFFSQVS